MISTGTEPGDFVEYDMDALEADRQTKIRQALEAAKPELEKELGIPLRIVSDKGELVLADSEGVRFRVSSTPEGRLMVTDVRPTGELL